MVQISDLSLFRVFSKYYKEGSHQRFVSTEVQIIQYTTILKYDKEASSLPSEWNIKHQRRRQKIGKDIWKSFSEFFDLSKKFGTSLMMLDSILNGTSAG